MAGKNYNINSNLYVNDGKIVGGYNNIATGGTYSSIVGGNGNQIKSVSSFIGGGGINYINTRYTNIVGGYGNEINSGTPSIASYSAGFNSVGSGLFNYIGFSGLSNISISTNIIGGGLGNSIYSQYSTIGHGFDNRIGRNAKPYPGLAPELLITNNNDLFNSIVSGWRNEISGSFNSIGHGLLNNISVGTINGTIAGGWYNELSTTGSEYQPFTFTRWGIGQFIGGGNDNYIGGTTSASPSPSLDQQSQYSLVVGGKSNGVYNSPFSSIVGGTLNTLRTGSDFALLGGGINNTIESGKYSLIVGGRNNYMNDSYHSSIVGGYDNTIDSPGFLSRYQFIGGGKKNSLIGTSFGYLSDYSSIVGGELNLITGSTHSFIGGGKSNRNTNRYSGSYGYSVIGGGQGNNIFEDGWSMIGGGFQNKIEGSIPGSVWVNFIGGGGGNHLYSTSYSTIAGGQSNEIISIGPSIRAFNFIGGGRSNTINDANDSSIVGGRGNTIFTGNTHTFIGGGRNNTISVGSSYSFIGGGLNNTHTNGNLSSILGGRDSSLTGDFSSILGGRNNNLIGSYSSIVGGQSNTVNHSNSHIIGSSITSVSANTTHVERFNIGTIDNNESLNDVLVRDTDGTVRYRSSQSIADLFSGNTSGTCITDLYVSNIHSCSPLNINPLDEGNVYFGSTSGVTIDVINSRLGIGTSSPQYPLEIKDLNSQLSYDPTDAGGKFVLTGQTGIPRFTVRIPPYLSNPTAFGNIGIRTWDDATYSGRGKVGDMFIYSSGDANGLNIINQSGLGTEDYIRLYAGKNALSTSHLHIQGSGSTKGFVGINNDNPNRRLVVSGSKATLYVDTDEQDPSTVNQPGNRIHYQGNTSGATRMSFTTEGNVGIAIGQMGSDVGSFSGLTVFGRPNDSFIRSNGGANNLNIITQEGTTTDDHIRFYTRITKEGGVTGQTSAMHIQGSGTTKGYIGINNENPTERLDVSGNTIISGTLNIGTVDTGSTATEVLVRETNGIVNTVNLSTFTQQKYAASIPFTAATSQTVTHNLNDTDVIVQLKDSTGTLVIPDVVDNYTNNTVDIEVSSTETFRVIIIG